MFVSPLCIKLLRLVTAQLPEKFSPTGPGAGRTSLRRPSEEPEARHGHLAYKDSPFGGYVAFTSWSDNLVANDTNGARDVFVRDTQEGTTRRVSVSGSGAQGHFGAHNFGYSDSPSISADGRFVAFYSFANLVDPPIVGDAVFMHERTIDSSPLPPDTVLTSFPGDFTRSAAAAFRFSALDSEAARFQCKLDGARYRDCASPKSYSGLADGSHLFRVRAVDATGNFDPVPAESTFQVDTVKPTGTISINNGNNATSSRRVKLFLGARDPSPASGVSLMRFRNENTNTWTAWGDYATRTYWNLSSGAGTKTVSVQYKDRAGNVSAASKDTIKFNP